MSQGVLIFGGTFDPPHVAHTTLPPLAASRLGCDRVIYIPAAINPLKVDSPPTADHHRLAMLRLATRDIPNAEVSTIELERAGPSYTVDTLESFHKAFRDESLHLLIGCDQALDFHRWRSWERILKLATPAVMIRPPWDRESFGSALRERYEPDEAERWLRWTLDLPRIDANATEVRRRLANNEDVNGMLDPDVEAYIRRFGLYGAGAC